MRDYLLSAAAVIALLSSGAAAHDKPVTLMDGLGDHHHTIATSQKDAQSYFNQGLILTFAFNHAEAIRAFERARSSIPARRCRCGASPSARPQLQPAGSGRTS